MHGDFVDRTTGELRDKRFVAAHRGGPLSMEHHRQLANWAADCAEHVQPLFAAHSRNDRPRGAIEAARAWAKGGISVGDARKAAVEAHAAARASADPAATAAARSAGHAAATAHMADHSLGAALYALKAVEATGISSDRERRRQERRLPLNLRELVLSAQHYAEQRQGRGRRNKSA